jgi:serine/threonine-protein kinase RsbW
MTRRTTSAIYAELAGTPQAARQARELARQALGDDHPAVGDAELIVSELFANAIAHSHSGHPGGTIAVAVQAQPQPGDVRILVRDAGSADAPTQKTAAPDSERGRGIAIVSAVATEWGSHVIDGGRLTWCRLSIGQAPTRDPGREPEREACR